MDPFAVTFKIQTLCVCGSTEHICLVHTDTFLESPKETDSGYRGHTNDGHRSLESRIMDEVHFWGWIGGLEGVGVVLLFLCFVFLVPFLL